mmetsp:Transcript_34578/g.52887  ORF Transcript_34578/g.52887 Transcript_34578/m.52887 type:complete len:87 (+) Transcript_34578:2436-2696(+)
MFNEFLQKGAAIITNTSKQNQGPITQNVMSTLKERDERAIRAHLQEIDEILTRECFFCGSLLIDMVDNDIMEGETGPTQVDEFEIV